MPLTDDATTERASRLDRHITELLGIRHEMLSAAAAAAPLLARVHPSRQLSARNLVHYLTLRRHDIRELQLGLAELGLSSLGRAESSVLANVDAVLTAMHQLAGRPWVPTPEPAPDFDSGQLFLTEQTGELLGPPPPGRRARIMVTMPSEAADDPALIQHLLQSGMNAMRINCAHDDQARWLRMIDHLRRAEAALGMKCRLFMDLAGPKLRTGPLEPGPAVIKVRPDRDPCGRVLAPARIWFTDRDNPHASPSLGSAVLRVERGWLQGLKNGDRIAFRDARDARRRMRVVDVTDAGAWAEMSRTAYVVPGTILRREADERREEAVTEVGDLPALEDGIRLVPGDALLISRALDLGRQATHDRAGRLLTPPIIGCTIPQVFDDVRAGEPIWFDDGRIGGLIELVNHDHLHIRITHAPVTGATLRGDKGINLPESRLRIPALTPKDVADLAFVAQHADVVELSFANAAADVDLLQQHLEQLGARRPPIVLKIETRRGFDNLPDMLLAAMRQPVCGVMIARGDLAVECGFERLAEVQEEILWICEAAHVPVIWATQVLETLAKNGMASRAEITDAAMGHRAECVMLNKGPHVVTAVRTLDDILRRMQAHQAKKRAMLRELQLAHHLTPA